VPSCKPAAVTCVEVMFVTSMGKVMKEWVMALVAGGEGRRGGGGGLGGGRHGLAGKASEQR
jgi:hypothetical protein